MDPAVGERLAGARRRVRDDLERDPYLRYILLVTALLAGFGIWYRVPNFATADEYSRLIDPMKTAGRVISDPGYDSLRASVLDGRALGATFYLYGITLAPVFFVVLATGSVGEFAALGTLESRWTLWHAAPAWFWTASILIGRLATVTLALGCVYLTYRMGTHTGGRPVGRLSALLLSVSLVFVSMAHELGEDIPMVFFLLLTAYLALRYAEAGDRGTFLLGCGTGGLAIAFKLTGGVAVALLGGAHLLRARESEDPWGELLRSRLLAAGLLVGAVTIYVGIPSLLVGGPETLARRILRALTRKTAESTGSASIWYSIALHYLNGVGLPLFAAMVAGLLAPVARVARSRRIDPGEAVSILGVAVYLAVFSQWEFVRLHHLLPTVPLLAVLTAATLVRFRESRPEAGRVVIALLVVTTATYAVAGDVQYLTDPRDQATEWSKSNVPPGAEMVVYENSVADVAVVHGRPASHYNYSEEEPYTDLVRNESAFTDWMVTTPERRPGYIQLTSAEMTYLDPGSKTARNFPRRAAYIRDLVAGEFEYAPAASFGRRERIRSPAERLIRAGVIPQVEQRVPYVLILEREG